MPRRAIAAIAATIAGLGLLFSFKTPHRATTRPAAVAAGPQFGGGSTTAPGSGGSSTPSASGTYKDGTAAGPVEETQWGPVQVQVTISGGRITDVTALQTPSDHQRSVEINDQATPLLRQEVLTAQSAQIDGVSGATITSGGYVASLQAVLDQMHR